MARFLKDLAARRRWKAATRKRRALQKAAREMDLHETDGGSVWKSGKGGGHHDRI
jgi:hypothetical protein